MRNRYGRTRGRPIRELPRLVGTPTPRAHAVREERARIVVSSRDVRGSTRSGTLARAVLRERRETMFATTDEWGKLHCLRSVDPRCAAEHVRHVVSGEPALPTFGETASDEPRMAGRCHGHPRPRYGQWHQRLQHFEVGGRWAGEYRLAVGVQVELGRIRHGRQRVRVGGGLGSSG